MRFHRPFLAFLVAAVAAVFILGDAPRPVSKLRLKPRAALLTTTAAETAATPSTAAAEVEDAREPEAMGVARGYSRRERPIQSTEERDAAGKILRTRITRPAAAPGPVRYEETLVNDPEHGRVVVRRRMMAADHVLVKLKPGVERRQLEEAAARWGAGIQEAVRDGRSFVVRLPSIDVGAVPAALERLRAEKGMFAWVSPDHIRSIAQEQFPNDPRFGEQWGCHNTGQTIAPPPPLLQFTCVPGVDIDAPAGWDFFRGAPEHIIAVIDTGVNQEHEDLKDGKYFHLGELDPDDGIDDDGNGYADDSNGWDFVNVDNKPDDVHGHGTHVAGIAAARGDNSKGIAGVNQFGIVLALKAIDDEGHLLDLHAAQAIRYAADNGAYVANCSFAGEGEDLLLSEAITHALVRPANKGGPMLIVCAASNDSTDNDVTPQFPSSYPQENIISVMAIDYSDLKPVFSNWGRTSVDLAAPGDNILSTLTDGTYGYKRGTSMAAPFVAGAATMVAHANGLLTPLEVRDCILNGVEPVAALANLCVTQGRLNLDRAMTCSNGPPPPIDFDLIRFTAAAGDVAEGAATALLRVDRVGLGIGGASVRFAVSGGTALQGVDYTLPEGVLQWASGDLNPKFIEVLIEDDLDDEPNETVDVTLFQPLGALLGSPAATTLTILDDDAPATTLGANPRDFAFWKTEPSNGNHAYLFAAFTDAHGEELWRTDGTAAGTARVADLVLGTVGSGPAGLFSLQDGRVLFSADDGVAGRELWISDGTAAGTARVSDLNPGPAGSSPGRFFRSPGGPVLFTALTGEGEELWRSDGTALGTWRIKDIFPGAAGSGPRDFLALPGQTLFTADDGVNGRELWTTDGTAAGTVLVKDLKRGSSSPSGLTLAGFGGAVFAADGPEGNELWRSDGGAAGTLLIKDLKPGGGSSAPTGFFNGGPSTVFFGAVAQGAGRELWITDGTSNGTQLFQELNPGGSSSDPADFTRLTPFLFAFVATTSSAGREIWFSDGTPGGTARASDVVPGKKGGEPRSLRAGVHASAPLLFTADDGLSGRELWASNGTPAGTSRVLDLRSGLPGSDPAFLALTLVNGSYSYLMAADDGLHGRELYLTDGTAGGTYLLKDIR